MADTKVFPEVMTIGTTEVALEDGTVLAIFPIFNYAIRTDKYDVDGSPIYSASIGMNITIKHAPTLLCQTVGEKENGKGN